MNIDNVYWVSSVTGSSSNSGKTRKESLSTVMQAIAKCTDNTGYIIRVMPEHTEVITVDAFVCNVDGVKIIGEGTGMVKPTFTIKNSTVLTKGNVSWNNCIFNFV